MTLGWAIPPGAMWQGTEPDKSLSLGAAQAPEDKGILPGVVFPNLSLKQVTAQRHEKTRVKWTPSTREDM